VFALPTALGLIAGSGVHRLPRMIGEKQALGMILTGRACGAEGNAWLVNEWWRRARRSPPPGTGPT